MHPRIHMASRIVRVEHHSVNKQRIDIHSRILSSKARWVQMPCANHGLIGYLRCLLGSRIKRVGRKTDVTRAAISRHVVEESVNYNSIPREVTNQITSFLATKRLK